MDSDEISLHVYVILVFEKSKQKVFEVNINFNNVKSFGGSDGLLSFLSNQLKIKVTAKTHKLEIYHNDSWLNILDIQTLYFFLSSNLLLEQETKFKLTPKETEAVNQQFEDEEMIKLNNIDMKAIKPNKNIRCDICNQLSTDSYQTHRLGPMYGPFRYSQNKYYVHFLCALWLPKVWLSDTNKLVNVGKEVHRSRKSRCSYCGLKGAGLGCWLIETDGCKKKYHYLCAQSDECEFNRRSYGILCKDHKAKYKMPDTLQGANPELTVLKKCSDEEANKTNEVRCDVCLMSCDDDYLVCAECKKCFHEQCVGYVNYKKKDKIVEDEVNNLKQEEEDYICPYCKSKQK